MEEKEKNNSEKIQALREMIYNAERTLQGAKAMLLQLEGKKKVGRKKKTDEGDEEDGRIIQGTFDGQIMLGTDGKQYPVPANYASKSKLVEGDLLKLTITPEGSFIYKQIGPAERRRIIGIVNQDVDGNYFVVGEGKAYKVLLASVTYFKVEPGDEVTLVVPRDIDSDWGAIENILQKSRDVSPAQRYAATDIDEIINGKNSKSESAEPAPESKKEKPSENDKFSIIDEWAPDLEELKRELEDKDEK